MLLNNYEKLKRYFNILNLDKSHYVNSNDICTPIGCVEEMINKVPEDFWKKDNIKILDPCAGNGNFFGYIYHILKKYHSENKIINDILYFNEINEKRIGNIKKIFNSSNITKKDFLSFEEKEKYNMVVANPPYAKFSIDGKRVAKNHNLSRDFILKAINITKQNGYIVFIVPDNWMSFADRNKVVEVLSNYQFIWLNIHEAKKWFRGVGSSFTWFVLKKEENKRNFFVENFFKLKIKSSTSLVKNSSFIPLLYTDEVKSILSKTINKDNEKFEVKTSSILHKYTKKDFLSPIEDDVFKYKIIHTPSQVVWSKIPHKFQDGYKVFISLTNKYSLFIDNCGMTQSIAFISVSSLEEGEIIKKILSHPFYVFLNNICRYGNFNNIRVLQRFPKPKSFDVYNEFLITKDEQNLIEQFNKKN